MNKKIFVLLCAAVMTLIAPVANGASFFDKRIVNVAPSANECVGDTTDPLCVFDTVVACVIRDDTKLCDKVGLKYDQTMKNSLSYLSGQDYDYSPVEMYINHRVPDCEVADDKACVYNPSTEKIVPVEMSISNDRKMSIYLQRNKNKSWKVIFATEFECWSDEDCS